MSTLNNKNNILISSLLVILSTSISLLGAEAVIRVKNSKMNNYDIEMWRYSNNLKRKSENVLMDFEHQRNKSVKLQNVDIRINNLGLRGSDVSLERSSASLSGCVEDAIFLYRDFAQRSEFPSVPEAMFFLVHFQHHSY